MQKVLGSWEKQRALMVYEGACQVWTEGVTVPQLCYIRHPLPVAAVALLLAACVALLFSVFALFLTLPLQSTLKVLRVPCCIHSRRLPSWFQSAPRRMLRYATASLLFVFLRCNCAGWSCCIQPCKNSHLVLCDTHSRKCLI